MRGGKNMPTLPVLNMSGEQVGEIALNETIFGSKVNKALLHQAVVMQLASRRLGTAKAKTRSEVRGGGRKPYRQKGTGQARQGSRRAPNWTGGGIVFPPTPRSYDFSMPKKARREALKSALSAKVEAGEMIVMDSLTFNEPKTKNMVEMLDKIQAERKTLIVTANPEENVTKSGRNIPGVLTIQTNGINVYDLLRHDKLVITKDAVSKVEEALA
jgi:large subunit ribosomal protein L4